MPKIDAESLDEHRQLIRQKIFEALAELMGERSFDAITMAQIAERAELGRTAIYHHFPDKEAVVVAFASHETTRYIDRLSSALAEADGPVAELRTYVRHNLVAGEQFHAGLGPRLYGLMSNESRQAIREHVVAIEDVLRGILRRGRESGALHYDDDDAVAMSLVHACLAPREIPGQAIEDFIVRGLGGESGME